MYRTAKTRSGVIAGPRFYRMRTRKALLAGAEHVVNRIVQPPRACPLQAAPDAWREAVVPLAYGVLAGDDDGTNPSPGAIPTEGVDPGVLKEEDVEVWSGDDAPPVGLWSGEASGIASGVALGDDGTGDDGDREGVTVAAGGGTVE